MNEKNYDLHGKSLLILDDNEITRTTLKLIFEKQGATVYSAGHLEKGVTILKGLMARNQPPALIVTDIKLPGVYGFDVLRAIDDTVGSLKVPILIISRGLSDFALRRASFLGVAGYVQKPLLLDKVFDFANEIISAFETPNSEAKVDQKIIRAA